MLRPMAILLIKLGVRLVVFTAVFWIVAWTEAKKAAGPQKREPRVAISPRWATPIVATVFALANVGLYWALEPILNLATLGAIGFLMPLVVNFLLLAATVRLFEARKWIKVNGLFALLWLAIVVTAVHGVLWFAIDYLPPKLG